MSIFSPPKKGGKRSLPSGLPREYYQGFVGCIKKAKIFRKRLDLYRGGTSDHVGRSGPEPCQKNPHTK